MTTKEQLLKMLTDRGMSEQQANKVMELAIPKINEASGGYAVTFDSPAEQYPKVVFMAMFIVVKKTALEWIETNIPEAWFKPMFQ